MLIKIARPVFKCEMDENIFFSRLYKLANHNSVNDNGLSLSLTLSENSKEAAVEELQIICNIWGVTFKVLEY
jgi:hypothetical protein